MNLIEKLKNVPKGTKMYSPLFQEPLEFVEIGCSALFPIVMRTSAGELINFTKEGHVSTHTATQNCMLFPTSEMTWEGYKYFKKGDIIASENTICIVDHVANLRTIENVIYYQACIDSLGRLHVKTDSGVGTVERNHLAGRIEKQRILRMLDEAGYEFDGVNVIPKKHKFTPFEKVLVRDNNKFEWKCDFFSHIIENGAFPFRCVGYFYSQCIPYNEETKHFVGTTNMPPKKYITWE